MNVEGLELSKHSVAFLKRHKRLVLRYIHFCVAGGAPAILTAWS